MNINEVFKEQFRIAMEQINLIDPSKIIHDGDDLRRYASTDSFDEFVAKLVIPETERSLGQIIDCVNECVDRFEDAKRIFMLNQRTVSDFVFKGHPIEAVEINIENKERIRWLLKKYRFDYSAMTKIEDDLWLVSRRISKKLEKLKDSIYKWDFKETTYINGLAIAATLRDQLVREGFLNPQHVNSSKENFKLLFRSKSDNPFRCAQPIVWIGSYPQLYYLVSKLTKKIIREKRKKPMHIGVALKIFRNNNEDSVFDVKHIRPSDPPADKEILDKIIAATEREVFFPKKTRL